MSQLPEGAIFLQSPDVRQGHPVERVVLAGGVDGHIAENLRQKGLSTVEDLEAFLEASGKSAADYRNCYKTLCSPQFKYLV